MSNDGVQYTTVAVELLMCARYDLLCWKLAYSVLMQHSLNSVSLLFLHSLHFMHSQFSFRNSKLN